MSAVAANAERMGTSEALGDSIRDAVELRAALDEHAMLAVTDPRGRILYVNDKLCAISQYTRGELLGQDHRLLNSGYHAQGFFQVFWETLQRGQVWHGEMKNRAKDGSLYWVAMTAVPSFDEHG